MTRDPVGRRGVGTFDSLRRLDTATVLTTILVLGLALRVFIAAFYMPLSGLSNDIGAFNAWGQRLASVGPAEFYAPDYFADYPPGYLYVLWLLGEIGAALCADRRDQHHRWAGEDPGDPRPTSPSRGSSS